MANTKKSLDDFERKIISLIDRYKSIEVEKTMIGILLTEEASIIEALAALDTSAFTDSKCKECFSVIISVREQNGDVSTQLVASRLQQTGIFTTEEEANFFLSDCIDLFPGSNQYRHFIYSMQDNKNMRDFLSSILKVIQNIVNAESKEIANIPDFIATNEQLIANVATQRRTEEFVSASLATQQVIQYQHERTLLFEKDPTSARLGITGVPSGYEDLDTITHGFNKGELVIIGARPGMGKTALALNFAFRVAKKKDASVAYFTLEMSAASIMQRVIQIIGQITLQEITSLGLKYDKVRNSFIISNKDVPEETKQKFEAAYSIARNLNLYIDDSSTITMEQVSQKIRTLKNKEPNLSLVIIDYLGLITPSNNVSRENRTNQIGDISKKLKALSREFDVCVVALSQLSRGVDSREDNIPALSDLRDSGNIEQDADIVMALYSPRFYKKPSSDPKAKVNNPENNEPVSEFDNDFKVIVLKNRNGRNNTDVTFSLHRPTFTFNALDKEK